MGKQTKLVKAMVAALIIIPIILFFTGIVQTFVLKDSQRKLAIAQNELAAAKEQQADISDKYNYAFNEDGSISEEYLKEHYKHSSSDSYGDEGDVEVTTK